MNDQGGILTAWEESAETTRLEADWSESEWFQVWLELARLPHKSSDIELNSEARAIPVSDALQQNCRCSDNSTGSE